MNRISNTYLSIDGLSIIRGIISGKFPPPSITKSIPMSIIVAEPGFVRFTAKADEKHLNPLGGVHGGFAATVLDSVTGCAIHTRLGAGEIYSTVDLTIKMTKLVPMGKELIAEGKIIHMSNRLGVSEGILKDEEGTLYAHATATCMIHRTPEKSHPKH
jgi:uncharacterized protein (TIGR00369 family)